MKNIVIVSILMAILSFSCQTKDQGRKKGSTTPDAPEISWSLEEIWKSDTLMRTCESVRFDENGKQLFVTCINGAPWEKDGMGFISILNLDGSIKTERWVTGLDAPKGMGIYEGLLYVADVDQIVVIDIEKAAIVKKIEVPGAGHLNDIYIDTKGKVYFSDSEHGWIWTMENDEPVQWIGDFESPNGLFVEDDRVLLASSGSQDMTVINLNDNSQEVVTQEIGHGDGIEFIGKKGYYLVTSWSGEIFLIMPDFSKLSLLKTSDKGINTADIGFNIADQTLYVPTFFDNRVVAYKLIESGK